MTFLFQYGKPSLRGQVRGNQLCRMIKKVVKSEARNAPDLIILVETISNDQNQNVTN
jgi:hypothetical protein